jgi:hypothetical protein
MSRLAATSAIAAVAALATGCSGAVIATQVLPAALGGVALAGSESRDPFITYAPDATVPRDPGLDELQARVQRAECGDAAAQYWLASAMRNNFNASPDKVAIYQWYRLADLGGYGPAGGELSLMAASMSAEEIAEGEKRAVGWQPVARDCPARS